MTNSFDKKIKDGTGAMGVVTRVKYFLESSRAFEIDSLLESAREMPHEEYAALLSELASICRTETVVKKNRCVKAGRSMTVGIWAGETTYTGIINYGLLGSSSTAVADADTQLGTEVKRKALASRSRTDDQVNFDFYYSKSDTSGTYQEFGMVVDGTTGANTGVLFNRLLTGGWTKSSSEALTVSVQINHNAA